VLMNKEKLLIEIINTELRVLSGIGVIVGEPERYKEGFKKVRDAFRELKNHVRKEES